MADERDHNSLGGDVTREGRIRFSTPVDLSLGDTPTLHGVAGADDGPPADDLELVDLSSRYALGQVLGTGGMGEVVLATDLRLKRQVAIKRVLGGAKTATAVRRFLTEAQSVAALNHPNIVQIYDYGRDADGPFLILEYVGRSLLDLCQGGPLPLEDAIELACQVCDGLGRAHDAGIIHRDIKPANILLTQSGSPKLTDFGLAKDRAADTGQTMAGAVLGTLDFMPPEQRQDAALADARSDLWSLAATLYQMVTGRSPRIINLKQVPAALQEVLARALEEAQADRYQTAREFRDALRGCLHQHGSPDLELEEGQCPHCGTKNESRRKFCRKCAGSLEAPCLSCAEGMPLYEDVCGNCGGRQSELLEQRRAEMASRRQQAENLLNDFEYSQANEIATALLNEPHLRLQHLKNWAEDFLEELDRHRQQQQDRIHMLLHEALQHESAYDDLAGIHTLEQVPVPLREDPVSGDNTSTVATVLARLQERQDQSHHLDQAIRQRVKERKLTGLQSEVDSLLKLRPMRTDLARLRQQLIERDSKLQTVRDTAHAEGKRLFNVQRYEECLSELAKIDPSVMRPEDLALQQQAQANRDRLAELRSAVLADVQRKEVYGLLERVDECLQLRGDDPEMQQLRGRLLAHEEKQAAKFQEILEEATVNRAACRFEAAIMILGRIPVELQTPDAIELLEDCRLLVRQQRTVIAALQSKSYSAASAVLEEYRKMLRKKSLTDVAIELLYRNREQMALTVRQATDRWKLLFAKRLGILTVVVLAFTAIFSFRNSDRAMQQPVRPLGTMGSDVINVPVASSSKKLGPEAESPGFPMKQPERATPAEGLAAKTSTTPSAAGIDRKRPPDPPEDPTPTEVATLDGGKAPKTLSTKPTPEKMPAEPAVAPMPPAEHAEVTPLAPSVIKKPASAGPQRPAATPGRPMAMGVEVATYRSFEGLVMVFDSAQRHWFPLARRTIVRAGDVLAVSEPFESLFEFDQGKGTVRLLDGTLVGVMGANPLAATGWELDRGRMVMKLTAGASRKPFALKVRPTMWLVELLSDDTVMGVEVVPRLPHALEEDLTGREFTGGIYVETGSARITGPDKMEQTLIAPNWYPLTADSQFTAAPKWLGESTLSKVQRQQAKLFEELLVDPTATSRTAIDLIAPGVASDRRPQLAQLAVACLDLMGAYVPLVDALKSENGHEESRLTAIHGLQAWLPRNPENRDLLRDELAKRFQPADVEVMYRLLWGFNETDAKNSDTSKKLVEWLGHPEISIRELAFHHVLTLTGNAKRYNYRPNDGPVQRESSLRSWRNHIKNGTLVAP